MQMGRLSRGLAVLLFAVLTASALAACGGGGSSSSTTGGGGSTEGGATPANGSGTQEIAAEYEGTQTEPPTASNKAATGKSVWVISAGQASPSSAIPSEYAVEAGKKIGWKMTLFDGELSPSKYNAGIRQAIAAHADGIILVAVSCTDVKGALEAAKQAGIPVNGSIFSFDCSESKSGEPSLITAPTSFGKRYPDLRAYQEAWGAANADWAIEQAEGKPNSILLDNQQYESLAIGADVFRKELEACSGCKVTDVPVTVEEFGPPLTSKVQTALVKEPAADSVFFAATPLAGVSQGVVQSGRAADIKVISGTGLPEEFETLESGEGGLNAMVAKPQLWSSYAAIDTLNSVFDGSEPEDEGLGFQVFDTEHLPEDTKEPIGKDIPATYMKRWGLG
jgi:ribose transport system substrate-binding protein